MRKLILSGLLVLLLGCAAPVHIGREPPPKPKLRYGWSPERSMIVNGREERVRCMTVDDIERLRQYIILLEGR